MAHLVGICTPVILLLALIFQSFCRPCALASSASTAVPSACYPADHDALMIVSAWLRPDVAAHWAPRQGPDCCLWAGVTCSPFNSSTSVNSSAMPMVYYRVVGLTLAASLKDHTYASSTSSHHRRSHLIFSATCQLSALVSLDLSWNGLIGPIATCISLNLTSLQTLRLSGNGLSGSFFSVATLPLLTLLDLSDNALTDDLSSLQLRSRSLEYLDLGGNHLSGSAVSFINSLPTSLRDLDLHSNRNLILSQLPPAAFSNTPLLRHLSLGFVPAHSLGNMFCMKQLGSLESLEIIRASAAQSSTESSVLYDKLNCMKPASVNLTFLQLRWQGYTGPFPPWIAHFTNLRGLFLSPGNQFQGSIPQEWQALTQLQELWLSGDSPLAPVPLSQEVQSWLFRLPLQDLGLNFMGLTSQDFPCAGFSLLNLTLSYLDLSFNNISSPGVSTLLHCLIQPHNFSLLVSLSLSGNPLAVPLQRHMFPVSIVEIDLSYCQLFGSLSGIRTLPLASYIDLSHNDLTGSIPSRIIGGGGGLRSIGVVQYVGGELQPILHLDLSYNKLTGTIPSPIWNITAPGVLWLNFDSNFLHGKLDLREQEAQLGFVGALSIANNHLSRAYLYNASVIELVDLSNNQLGGTLESLLRSDFPVMEVLSLHSNQLTGSIPASLAASSPNLITLDLSNNKLTGAIPLTLGHDLQALQSNLQTLLSRARNLLPYYRIDLVPFCYSRVKNVQNFTATRFLRGHLDFSANQLNGTIPNSLGELRGLNDLDLSRNNLSGPIPSRLAHLMSLESLDLSFNSLEGVIPSELRALTSLAVFNVSFNPKLSGQIPEGPQLETASSYEGDPELCGQAINKSCTSEQQIDEGKSVPTCSTTTGQQPDCNTQPALMGFKSRLASFIKWIEEWVAIPAIIIGSVVGGAITVWGLKSLHFFK